MPSVYSTTSSSSSIYEDLGLNTTESVKEAASQVKDQTLTQEDFLMLLTTQLQAQDPTNPADNTELVSQMSQLSMVESLNSINTSMDGIIEQVKSSSALNATSLIGTYVYTDSNKGFFDGSNTLSWAIDAGDETYYDLELTIKDASRMAQWRLHRPASMRAIPAPVMRLPPLMVPTPVLIPIRARVMRSPMAMRAPPILIPHSISCAPPVSTS